MPSGRKIGGKRVIQCDGYIWEDRGLYLSKLALVVPQMSKFANWTCVTIAPVKWRAEREDFTRAV